MTPQDHLIIAATVAEGRVTDLRALLAAMTLQGFPGAADPANEILPFGRFATIHFARFVVLEDHTLGDRAAYPELPKSEPIHLCLMIDCDGDATELMKRIARECPGLRRAFALCADFGDASDLERWMAAHRIESSASYVNWLGRTVVQAREEARLRDLLREALPQVAAREPQAMLQALRAAVAPEVTLTPIQPTPNAWRNANLFHLLAPIVVAAALLIFAPVATIAIAFVAMVVVLVALRRRELTDPIVENPYDPDWVARLRLGEDHDVTNPYTAMGSIKPGRFRLGLELVVLAVINWAARHIFTRGGLGRIGTIHFAHWVLIDDRRRAFFCSNYDGGHEAYMDDFINKAGFGLNLSFSSAIAYPQTDWLIKKGAWREMNFKRFQRRHQIPTDVWYKAYPGLTAHDLARNTRIRNGFEKPDMDDDEIRRWLAEI
ncbi:MAG: hypothetical protein JO288_06880 [Hyphomicrobiales bacterium]|nr:hypothetical protein [Hyphomicrobiales bacterium]